MALRSASLLFRSSPNPGSAAITVGGIVYLSRNGMHNVEDPPLVADLRRLLPAEEAQRLQRL